MLNFETLLSGGHPNSLGNTLKVVDVVLKDQARLEELFQCYFSDDEVVRLRTSSAIKRICKVQPQWIVPYIDRLLDDISKIDQASTQWTLAILFDWLLSEMTDGQHDQACHILKHNLANHKDWIVLNTTMDTLGKWAKNDKELNSWIKPHLLRLQKDTRNSVSRKAKKIWSTLS